MSDNTRPPTNITRIAVGLAGLVLGFVIIFIGLNALSTSDAPPPETPRVQTGSLPPGTASTTTSGSAISGSATSPQPTSEGTAPRS